MTSEYVDSYIEGHTAITAAIRHSTGQGPLSRDGYERFAENDSCGRLAQLAFAACDHESIISHDDDADGDEPFTPLESDASVAVDL